MLRRVAAACASDFARVVAEAHAQGITTSADLLFDLPGQTTAQILADAGARKNRVVFAIAISGISPHFHG